MGNLRIGPVWGSSGGESPETAGPSGAFRVMDAHGKYLDALLNARAFELTVAAGAATAYVGAAGGTPLAALHNPANSGMVASLLAVGVGGRVAASAAGTVGFNLWSGPSVQPTGTQTSPKNLLSLTTGGAAMLGFANAALTGSTALTLHLPLGSYYWATGAGAVLAPLFFNLEGLAVILPGNQIALGGTAALTSATYDVAMIWEEIPLAVYA